MFSSNTSQQSEGYQIQRSLRFNSADSAYLNRTPASAGNQKTWTWSGWIKRSTLGARQGLMVTTNAGATDYFVFEFDAYDRFFVQGRRTADSLSSIVLPTVAVYRDTSAWYHVVLSFDTTQATASDRVKAYINGVQATFNSTEPNFAYPAQNSEYRVNTTNSHAIGSFDLLNILYLSGYMTEVNFIDGQALTPSSFGQTNANTGVWEPKPYAGTYGTNGFYLNFSDNSNTTATTLGKDYSGNGNNWTPNNFSVAAGAGNDSLVDVPTPWGTDTGVGGEVRGNYATMNPLQKSSNVTLTNGNLDSAVGSSDGKVLATIGMSSGKWYAETSNFVGAPTVGIATGASTLSLFTGGDVNSWGYFPSGAKYTNSAPSTYGASWTSSDTIGIAFDADAGTLTFYKNGISQGTAFSGLTSGPYFFSNGNSANTSCSWNFGQRPFAYTAPSGFKALCTQNLPTPTIGATTATQANKYFDATLFTGTGSPLTVVNAGGFQPDLVWTKNRSSVAAHYLTNVLSGVSQYLSSDSTSAELTGTQLYTSFNSNGFSMGTSGYPNGAAVVAWQWKANGAGVTNTAGSITSTVSANTTSGFSVVTFTGTGSAATVGHGLGSAPKFIIQKRRNDAGGWNCYHASLPVDYRIDLNTTAAATYDPGAWNATRPTSSVYSIQNPGNTNISGATYVAYCFAEVQGFSKFGSYTGNGSTDGPFVYCGFRPAYVMIKKSSSTGNITNWYLQDTKRDPYNLASNYLNANNSDAESSSTTVVSLDILSNGFKLKSNNGTFGNNQPGETYIFAAFADFPQKFSLAR